MKHVQITLYSLDELSNEAKERALSNWNRHFTYAWAGEVRDTIRAFEEEFGVTLQSYDYSACDYRFDMRTGQISDDVLALRGNRARAWFWNNHGGVLLQPRKTWWYRDKATGKWREGLLCGSGEPNPVRKSKVFLERVYDGTCPFTGVCFDCDALDPIAYFCFGVRWDDGLKKRVPVRPTRAEDDANTVEGLLHAGMDALFRSVMADCAYYQSMEAFAETCTTNDYTFLEDGEMYNAPSARHAATATKAA